MLNKSLLFLVLTALVMTGCKDDEKNPIVTQDQLLFGAFPRLIELRTGEFDLANLSTSAYEMEVDFVDNANGEDVAQYNVIVSFDDNNPDNGDNSTPFQQFKSFGPSDFRAGPNGNLGIDLSISFSEVAGFVGVALDDVISGDRFQVRTEVVKEDGRVFGSDNSTSAITSAFGGLFDFNVNATCPLPDDVFVGDYVLTYGEVYDPASIFGRTIQALGPAPLDRTVTLSLISGSTTRRELTTQYLVPSDLESTVTGTLDFACDMVTIVWSDSGVRCAGDGWRPVQRDDASFTLTDDTTWEIPHYDFGDFDGSCGISQMDYSLIWTKQ